MQHSVINVSPLTVHCAAGYHPKKPQYISYQYCRQELWYSKSRLNYWRGGWGFYKSIYSMLPSVDHMVD